MFPIKIMPNPSTISTEFLQQLKAKDIKAFEQLYTMYNGAIYAVLLNILKQNEVAEDALQESFFKVWNNLENYDASKSSIYTWILNISRNTALDILRKQNVRANINNKSFEVNEEMATTQGTNINVIGVSKWVNKLSKEQQIAIKAVYYNGLTHQEAAEALQIPLGTLKSRVKTALNNLKNVFS